MKTVLLVDDHDEARTRMRGLVEDVLVGTQVFESATIGGAHARIAENTFDLAILDLALPDGSGEDLIDPILEKNPNCYVVISTIHDESKRLIGALSRGAKGYLLKEQPEDLLKQAIEGIRLGVPPLSASVTRRILEYLRQTADDDRGHHSPAEFNGNVPGSPTVPNMTWSVGDLQDLTPREVEILVLLARGFNRPDIAGMLNISKHTVATHVSNIYAKLNIATRIEAAAAARALGLL